MEVYKPPRPRVEVFHKGSAIDVQPIETAKRHKQKKIWYDDCGDWCGWETLVLTTRFLVAIAGAILIFAGVYSLYPIRVSLKKIPLSVTKLYIGFFGLTILLLEGKSMLPDHNKLRKWFYSEFHFLQGPGGKGLYFLFVGMLSLALGSEHFLFLCCGGLITLMGMVNLTISLISKRQLRRQTGLHLSDFATTTAVPNCNHKRGHGRARRHDHKIYERRIHDGDMTERNAEVPITYYLPKPLRREDEQLTPLLHYQDAEVNELLRPAILPPVLMHPQAPARQAGTFGAVEANDIRVMNHGGGEYESDMEMASYTDPLKFTSYIHQ